MAAVTVELIKQLRDRTGAGLMDCKGALIACDGDLDKAGDYLREKGLAKAAKKAGRIAAEGLALTKVCEKCGAVVILEINCETDFVAKGDAFRKLVDDAAGLLLANRPASLEAAKELTSELFADATVKMGEKLDLRRFEVLEKKEGQSIFSYIHMGGKIAAADLSGRIGVDIGAVPIHVVNEHNGKQGNQQTDPDRNPENQILVPKPISRDSPTFHESSANFLCPQEIGRTSSSRLRCRRMSDDNRKTTEFPAELRQITIS